MSLIDHIWRYVWGMSWFLATTAFRGVASSFSTARQTWDKTLSARYNGITIGNGRLYAYYIRAGKASEHT